MTTIMMTVTLFFKSSIHSNVVFCVISSVIHAIILSILFAIVSSVFLSFVNTVIFSTIWSLLLINTLFKQDSIGRAKITPESMIFVS
ncbi:hypothetical protein CHS0354_011683, partial [Potamilus streckersoni]